VINSASLRRSALAGLGAVVLLTSVTVHAQGGRQGQA